MNEESLPKHEASLHITHNQHKAYYEPIEEYLRDRNIDDEDWATPTSKERAIQTNNLWELQWYPNTPVGFNIVYGATLEEVIKKANE
jgi:hypothetical protein